MATLDDLRAIAARLPEAMVSEEERFGLSVPIRGKPKGFVWGWAERIHPKKARVINNEVMAIVVPNLTAKDLLMESLNPAVVVVDPHYNGYPAILVRLEAIEVAELTDLVIEAWRCKAPRKIVDDYDAAVTPPTL